MNYKFILASNSPRRKELLAGLDIPFEVKVISGIDEVILLTSMLIRWQNSFARKRLRLIVRF